MKVWRKATKNFIHIAICYESFPCEFKNKTFVVLF